MSDLLQIRRPIEEELQHYMSLFDEVLTHKEPFMDRALGYVRSRKGKMMRPILVLLLAKELGELTEATVRSAVTLELLHTSSLVHDDVVDESDERRGQASVHKIYDNKIAVLLGDYMLSRTLYQAAMTQNIAIVEVVSNLGSTISEGEIHQLANVETDYISETAYYSIIKGKTAALFAACGEVAAIAMGGSAQYRDKAKKFGEIVGICFQIRDDIFDYFDDAKIGKPRGNDMREGKLTLPVIYTVNTTGDARARELAMKVKAFKATVEEIAELIEFAKAHGGIEYAQQKMEELRGDAMAFLAELKNAEIREALTHYIDFVIGRGY